MATVMEFELPAAEFPLGSVFESFPSATVELERLIPHGPTIIPYFWVRGVDASDIESDFETHPGIVDLDLVDRVEDEYLLKVEWERSYAGIMNALTSTEVVVLSGVGTADAWRFEVRAEHRSDMGELQTYCTEHDIPIEVVAVHALLPVSDERFGLTDTQREALVLAYERGYFDSPRRTALETIADELDITQQSLSSRLRRGHRRLLEATLIGGEQRSDSENST